MYVKGQTKKAQTKNEQNPVVIKTIKREIATLERLNRKANTDIKTMSGSLEERVRNYQAGLEAINASKIALIKSTITLREKAIRKLLKQLEEMGVKIMYDEEEDIEEVEEGDEEDEEDEDEDEEEDE